MWTRRFTRVFSSTHNENVSILKRELFADVFQNILKIGAFRLSHSQAVKAEVMRSLLDAGNHVILYFANRWCQQKPDDKFNYGYGKFKNFSVILPGFCFVFSGLYNVLTPFLYIGSPFEQIPQLSFTPLSLSTIVLSSLGEFWVYYKNLGDIKEDKNLPLLKRVYQRVKLSLDIIQGKFKCDPIESTIVAENVLAILGVSMPIITSIVCYSTGVVWFDLLGELLNGCIEIYLGILICTENVKVLIGQSISTEELIKIKKLLKSKEDIIVVDDLKTQYLGNEKLKVSAAFNLDNKDINEKILESLYHDVRKITNNEDLIKQIENIIVKSNNMVLTHTTEIIEDLEEDIRAEFPYVVEIDLEPSRKMIKEEYRGLIPVSSSSDDEDDNKEIIERVIG